ncbi:MAG: RNA-binding transcriptional accessory protein [Candidatus Omnitrophica bacterium]|nr:RNA-binding transcriptional accessory protein [Candidatus Omnitrophota bacterium]
MQTVEAIPIEQYIAQELSVKPAQIWAAIKLLDEGATIPFIARYRKEATGGLTDVHLRALQDRLEYLRELESRRITVLQTIGDQGRLTEKLKLQINGARTKQELEDLYLPYKPRRLTKAQAAREAGLEALTHRILGNPEVDPETAAQEFVDVEGGIPDAAMALLGAREIFIENLTENAELLKNLREKAWKELWLVSAPLNKSPEAASKFADYFGFSQRVCEVPSHRVMAILRGQKEKALKVNLADNIYSSEARIAAPNEGEWIQTVCLFAGVSFANRAADAWIRESIRQAWKTKLRFKIEFDVMARLREKAEEEAIRVFAENLKNLLLAAPAGPSNVLGVDPGFKNGVKMAAVNSTGKVLKAVTIYPHTSKNQWEVSIEVIHLMIQRYEIKLIAIGNGTASRETEKLIDAVRAKYPDDAVRRVVVSEAGASVYSASPLASKELPDLDVTLRGAVSIARRLQDPLAELVKIDPKSIGVGQYQHDVSQARLAKMLHRVVEDCVNSVGVDMNTASPALLSYVSGLTARLAEAIVRERDARGRFKSREELRRIPELTNLAFQQAAGFLRISGGDNPLDASAVHPESYPVVNRILEASGRTIGQIIGNRSFLDSLEPSRFTDEVFGPETVEDILEELDKPGRDPRPEFTTAAFMEGVCEVKDLKPGMKLEGTVTNVANFGAFVDIGVHQDGLVHISELADEYVENPGEFVRVGDIVRVMVLEVDLERNRIALSMRRKKRPSSR